MKGFLEYALCAVERIVSKFKLAYYQLDELVVVSSFAEREKHRCEGP